MNEQKRKIAWQDLNRGTGRTQRMLREVVESVKEGKSLIRVLGHSQTYAIELMKRLVPMLEANQIQVIRKSTQGHIDTASGCKIRFHSMQQDLRVIDYGIRDLMYFYDHFWGNR